MANRAETIIGHGMPCRNDCKAHCITSAKSTLPKRKHGKCVAYARRRLVLATPSHDVIRNHDVTHGRHVAFCCKTSSGMFYWYGIQAPRHKRHACQDRIVIDSFVIGSGSRKMGLSYSDVASADVCQSEFAHTFLSIRCSRR